MSTRRSQTRREGKGSFTPPSKQRAASSVQAACKQRARSVYAQSAFRFPHPVAQAIYSASNPCQLSAKKSRALTLEPVLRNSGAETPSLLFPPVAENPKQGSAQQPRLFFLLAFSLSPCPFLSPSFSLCLEVLPALREIFVRLQAGYPVSGPGELRQIRALKPRLKSHAALATFLVRQAVPERFARATRALRRGERRAR